MAASAPFSRAVVSTMRKLYPEALADKSWDNTGLLLEAPFQPSHRNKNSVLLTIDLTKAVADEAIERKSSIVVAYHPIIFKGLKSLTLANTQQQSLLRLAAQGISVYSPHTAFDAAPGGLGDWIADVISGKVSAGAAGIELGVISHKRTSIKSVTVEGIEGAGMGRILTFDKPEPLTSILERIPFLVPEGHRSFPIAIPQGSKASEISVRSVAVCAGSGGSLFGGLDVDLFVTGELSHHEALAALEKGQCVVAPFHSNTERGFLHAVLKGQLTKSVKEEWNKLRKVELEESGDSEDVLEALRDESVEIAISEKDRDPYEVFHIAS